MAEGRIMIPELSSFCSFTVIVELMVKYLICSCKTKISLSVSPGEVSQYQCAGDKGRHFKVRLYSSKGSKLTDC